MSAPLTTLQSKLVETLKADLTRGELLNAMHALARENGFRQLSHVWAPNLLLRDAAFFENFLLKYLRGWEHRELIKAMLPYIEAAGRTNLFSRLYNQVMGDDDWQQDVTALAGSSLPDEEVLAALERRTPARSWRSLLQQPAVALYQRSPKLFGPFVRQNLRPRWNRQQGQYRELSELAQQYGDNELYWAIFRNTADNKQWNNELKRLLKQRPPADQIVAELEKRHPAFVYQYNFEILLDFLEKYGEEVLPYIERNLNWIARDNRNRLFEGLKRLKNDAVYWPLFFKVSNTEQWNVELRKVLDQKLSDFDLMLALQMRTPDLQSGWAWMRWHLDSDIALALYRRNAQLFRPFIETFLRTPGQELFQEAEKRGNEAFLDYLAFRMLQQIQSLAWRAFPPEWYHRWQKPDEQARRQLEAISALLIGRLERLYADSPQTYVRHAANVLSHLRAFEVWSYRKTIEQNPVFRYLVEQHHETWQASADGIRELLESPNIFVQIAGLEILSKGGADAAQRIIENLPMLQALLLGRAKRNTKKRALNALVEAAHQGPQYADAILPVLRLVMDLRGKRAIADQVMVSYVRLRRALGEPAAAD